MKCYLIQAMICFIKYSYVRPSSNLLREKIQVVRKKIDKSLSRILSLPHY